MPDCYKHQAHCKRDCHNLTAACCAGCWPLWDRQVQVRCLTASCHGIGNCIHWYVLALQAVQLRNKVNMQRLLCI